MVFIFLILCSFSVSQYETVDSHGLDIHFRQYGEGAPILILGGGPGDVSDRYVSLCDVISKGYRCILVDQRGTGKSKPDVLDETTISIQLTLEDLEAIRKKLGLDTWHVLGFSYGGYLASSYARAFPSSVKSLILLGSMGLNTNAFGHFKDNIFSRMQLADHELYAYWNDRERTEEDTKHALVERIRAMMPGYFFDRKKSLLVSQSMKDSDFDFDMGQWIWKDITDNNRDLTLTKSNFVKPVLILHGRQDPLGESVPQSLLHFYPDAKLVFIEQCGHYSWIEQPENVYAEIDEFLKPEQ